jgi:hypothetical protein
MKIASYFLALVASASPSSLLASASTEVQRKTSSSRQIYNSKPFLTDARATKQVGVPLNRKKDSRELSVDNSNSCFLEINITCTPKDTSIADCESLFKIQKEAECTAPAREFMFGFTGGNCDNSFNMESSNSFICRDFHGGPASHNGDENYIVASSPRAVGNKYFSGTVSVKSAFTLMDDWTGVNATILPETMILVYADDTMEKLLQLMIFKTACEKDIAIGDDFGSVELVAFTSQGVTESAVVVAMYAITIRNNDASSPATITDVHTLVDNKPHDLYKTGLKGEVLDPGEEILVVEEMTVDLFLTQQEHYVSAFVAATGKHTCSAIGQLDIDFSTKY